MGILKTLGQRLLRKRPKARRGHGIADNTIQLHGHTAFDRYPEVFLKVKKLFEGKAGPFKILSFGCSTGEEVNTLATLYFTDAHDFKIVGVDIDPRSVRQAQKNNPQPDRVSFHESSDEVLAEHGPFDAIFAMSVLCAWPETRDLDDISGYMTFDDFERHVRHLDQQLKVGGHFVIYNASFCFTDTETSKGYEPILIDDHRQSGFVKKFDTSNQSLGADYHYDQVIFEKLPHKA